MMETWSHDEAFGPAEAEAHVGVNEHGMERHKHQVGVDRPVGESQQRDGDKREAARKHDVHQMQARSSEPVDRFA